MKKLTNTDAELKKALLIKKACTEAVVDRICSMKKVLLYKKLRKSLRKTPVKEPLFNNKKETFF